MQEALTQSRYKWRADAGIGSVKRPRLDQAKRSKHTSICLLTFVSVTLLLSNGRPSAALDCQTISAGMQEMALSRLRAQAERGLLNDRSMVARWIKNLLGGTSETPINRVSDDEVLACFPQSDLLIQKSLQTSREQKRQEDEEKRKSDQAKADSSKPEHVLTETYYEYIFIKRCHDARKGYLVILVSDRELDESRAAARGIEQKILDAYPAIKKDEVWRLANGAPHAWQTKSDPSYFGNTSQPNEMLCKLAFSTLMDRYRDMIPAPNVRKDF